MPAAQMPEVQTPVNWRAKDGRDEGMIVGFAAGPENSG